MALMCRHNARIYKGALYRQSLGLVYRQSITWSDAQLQHDRVAPHLQVFLANLQIDVVDVRVQLLLGNAALLEKSCEQLRV